MPPTSPYDITWDSPSANHDGSMPLGNGDISLNAWVEPGGDLVFYIGKTDSWGDNARLLKLGRLRVACEPALPTAAFTQTLSLADGSLRVRFGDSAVLRLWVDANHPLVQVELETSTPVIASASIELWRTAPYRLPSLEVSDVMLDRSRPGQQRGVTVVEPDSLVTGRCDQIGWYHYNRKSVGPSHTRKTQGLDGFEQPDPLRHRTFGALVFSDRSVEAVADTVLLSPRGATHAFTVAVLTQHPSSPAAWLAAADALVATARASTVAARFTAHSAWWAAFWERSYIHVDGDADARHLSQAYAVQRYMNACAGRGAYPIKFNGSIFTVPYADKPGDADYRRWGGGYWWQNTRLPYISMPSSGDAEMMLPLFHMYARDLMPLCRYRTRQYFGHAGAYLPECIHFWGAVFAESYGWTPAAERDDKLQTSPWHKWEWVAGLELVFLMLDYYAHTQDHAFLADLLLPTAHDILTFFDEHYETGPDGKLHMHPSQALETWWDCDNPMPELAGLYAVTAQLLRLPPSRSSAAARAFWERLRAKLPPIPTHSIDGHEALAPATRFADKKNVEIPELYAVYPFRLYAFEKPGYDLALTALRHRDPVGYYGWRQDELFLAYLGLADETRTALVARARDGHGRQLDPDGRVPNPSRFPFFWGPNYDWLPDQDHGGVLLKALQAMLIQYDGDTIHLLPAWPRDWDVTFKLHAPGRTVLEGRFAAGALQELTVSPESRRADVIIRA